MRVTLRSLAVVAVCTVLAAGCSRAGGGSTTGTSTPTAASSASGAPGAASFGDLANVCHGGSASGSTDQGVTSSAISVGVLTDEAYTKDPELVNAATVFTGWCNAAGGIDGRKVVADVHQTDLMAVTAAMTSACGEDFALAGGAAALDGLAVSTRLKCLLPDYDAQPVMPQNTGSGLELRPYNYNFTYSAYAGFYQYMLQKYPDSVPHVGILSGNSIITQVDAEADADTIKHLGGTLAYNGTFPLTGAINWTPYAEAIKSKGIKGLTFYDTPEALIALEQALDNIGYKLDWVNANSNAYDTSFIKQAGGTLTDQANYAPLAGVYPIEKASDNPAMKQLTQLFAKYAPNQPITLQILQAWSMWLLFAESAETCGSGLTRACVYGAAVKQTAWTAGGLTAPVDEATPLQPASCFNVEQATASGWVAADFGANTGPYKCDGPQYKLPAGFPMATQLADVGLSLSDLK